MIYLSPWIDYEKEDALNRYDGINIYSRVRLDIMTGNIFYGVIHNKMIGKYTCFNRVFASVEDATQYFDEQIINKTFDDHRGKHIKLLKKYNKEFVNKIKSLR